MEQKPQTNTKERQHCAGGTIVPQAIPVRTCLLHPGGETSLTQKLSKGVPKPRPILAAKKEGEKGGNPQKEKGNRGVRIHLAQQKKGSKQASKKQATAPHLTEWDRIAASGLHVPSTHPVSGWSQSNQHALVHTALSRAHGSPASVAGRD